MDSLSERDYTEYRGVKVLVTDPISEEQRIEGLMREAGDKGYSIFSKREQTFEQTFTDIFDETYDLLIERQRKYGPKNIEQQGVFGILTRIKDDKLSRIMRALNGRVVNGTIVLDDIDLSGEEGDTLEDALKDVANYALIALALLRGVWGRPLSEEIE